MPRLPSLRTTLLNTRDLLLTAGPFALLVLALLVGAYWVLDPTPPKKLVLATGPEQGAYAEFGSRYKAQLAKFGVEVELRGTQGSAENLALLQDEASGVGVAFVQGGADRLRQPDEPPPPGLLSLGSLFHEPIWLFYRTEVAQQRLGGARLDKLSQLKGWSVNIGAPGSGITTQYTVGEAPSALYIQNPPNMGTLIQASSRPYPGNSHILDVRGSRTRDDAQNAALSSRADASEKGLLLSRHLQALPCARLSVLSVHQLTHACPCL